MSAPPRHRTRRGRWRVKCRAASLTPIEAESTENGDMAGRPRYRRLKASCRGLRDTVDRAPELLVDVFGHRFHRRIADHGEHLGGVHNADMDLAIVLVDDAVAGKQQAKAEIFDLPQSGVSPRAEKLNHLL